MQKPFQLIVPLALLSSLSLSAQKSALPRLEGHWEGVIVAVPAEMEVDFEIDFSHAGEGFQGHLCFLPQSETHQIQNLLLRNHAVSFSVVDEKNVGDFFAGTI